MFAYSDLNLLIETNSLACMEFDDNGAKNERKADIKKSGKRHIQTLTPSATKSLRLILHFWNVYSLNLICFTQEMFSLLSFPCKKKRRKKRLLIFQNHRVGGWYSPYAKPRIIPANISTKKLYIEFFFRYEHLINSYFFLFINDLYYLEVYSYMIIIEDIV